MPELRARMNEALLELVYDDPLDAWGDIPVLELNGPLDARLDTVLAALNQARAVRRRVRLSARVPAALQALAAILGDSRSSGSHRDDPPATS